MLVNTRGLNLKFACLPVGRHFKIYTLQYNLTRLFYNKHLALTSFISQILKIRSEKNGVMSWAWVDVLNTSH